MVMKKIKQSNANKKKQLLFTGERMIPSLNKGFTFYFEHLLRYTFAGQFVKNKSILDLGCGSGYGSYLLKIAGANTVLGIDIDHETISYAKEQYKRKGVTFREGDVTKNNLQPSSFDVVVSFEVIEHIKEHDTFIKSIKSCLVKNGVLCISTPNKKTYSSNNNPFHLMELDPSEFKSLLKKYFKHVYLFDQSFYFTNLLTPISSKNKKRSVLDEDLIYYEQEILKPDVNLNNSRYLVAVCSDKEISIRPTGLSTLNVDCFSLKDGVEGMYQDMIQKKSEIEDELNKIKASKFFVFMKLYNKIKRVFFSISHKR